MFREFDVWDLVGQFDENEESTDLIQWNLIDPSRVEISDNLERTDTPTADFQRISIVSENGGRQRFIRYKIVPVFREN